MSRAIVMHAPVISVAVTIAVAGVVGAIAACDGAVEGSPEADRDASVDASGICPPGAHCQPTCEGGIGQGRCPQVSDSSMHDATTSGRCEPADVSGFTPTPYHAANPHRDACTQTLIDQFYGACLDIDSIFPCSVFLAEDADAAHKFCADCIFTQSTASTYGPVIAQKGLLSVNVAGCMELADSAHGLACAKAYVASEECADDACHANCPVTDDASYQLYEACVQQAAANGCAAFTKAAKCADAEADGGPASVCFGGQTFRDQYDAIARLFCVARGDGGTDSGGD